MNCDEVLDLMQKYVDQEHTNAEYAALSEHLHRCTSCTAMFERLKQLSSELEQLPRVVPPYSIVDAILPKMERMTLLYQPTWKERIMERIPYKTLGSIAAGIILVFFLINSNFPKSLDNADEIINSLNNVKSAKTHSNSVADSQATAEKADASTMDSQNDKLQSAPEEPKSKELTDEPVTTMETENKSKAEFAQPLVGKKDDISDSTPSAAVKTFKPIPSPKPSTTKSPDSSKVIGFGMESSGEEKATLPPVNSIVPEHQALTPPSISQSQSPTPTATPSPTPSPRPVLTLDSEQFPSSDGSYIAYVQYNESSKQVVIDDRQLDTVYISPEKVVDQITLVVWSADNKHLTYDTIKDNVVRHYAVDVVHAQEIETEPAQ